VINKFNANILGRPGAHNYHHATTTQRFEESSYDRRIGKNIDWILLKSLNTNIVVVPMKQQIQNMKGKNITPQLPPRKIPP